LYCEDLWLASLFDSRFLTSDGIVRRHALLPSTVAALEALNPSVTLPTDPLDPVLGLALTRYFDDCRLVVYTADCPTSPRLRGISGWLVDSYKLDCYIKPCELEDEALGTTFSFLQGTYTFSSEGCRCLYMAKNTLSFSTLGKLKFYSMQHYLSFSQDRVRMRLAVLLGKLCEINAFSHPPSNVAFGLMSIIPDLALLGYPFSLLKKALAIMARRTGNEIWTISSGLASHFMVHIRAN
jgi:hypothetical protein